MSERTKQIAIIAVAALIGLGMYIYFSPYQSCVRGMADSDGRYIPEVYCARYSK